MSTPPLPSSRRPEHHGSAASACVGSSSPGLGAQCPLQIVTEQCHGLPSCGNSLWLECTKKKGQVHLKSILKSSNKQEKENMNYKLLSKTNALGCFRDLMNHESMEASLEVIKFQRKGKSCKSCKSQQLSPEHRQHQHTSGDAAHLKINYQSQEYVYIYFIYI